MTDRQPVVFDINIFIAAVVGGNSPFYSWPSPPPVSDNPAADCIGIVNDAREFSLWLSKHILLNIARVLVDPGEGFGWGPDAAEEYLELLMEIASASGGGIAEPQDRVTDCTDHEDNRILELALACDAVLIVSNDKRDLTSMSPWRTRPIITAREFANRVDVVRRRQR